MVVGSTLVSDMPVIISWTSYPPQTPLQAGYAVGSLMIDYHRSIMDTDSLEGGLLFPGDARHMNTLGSVVYALFSKKYSSFSMYEEKQGEYFVPYQASSIVCGKEKDRKFITGLRQWLDEIQLDSALESFGNGPRKPQTRVHYATPSESS